MPRQRRRYGASVRKMNFGLTEQTITAMEKLVPDGQRSEFVEDAIRIHLARRARELGLGDVPGERLTAIAASLEQAAQELRHHSGWWGDLDDLDLERLPAK
jgi:hypothetical protein